MEHPQLFLVLLFQWLHLHLFQEKEESLFCFHFQSNSFFSWVYWCSTQAFIYLDNTKHVQDIWVCSFNCSKFERVIEEIVFTEREKVSSIVFQSGYSRFEWNFIFLCCVVVNPDWSKAVTQNLFLRSTSLFELWPVWYQHAAFSMINI